MASTPPLIPPVLSGLQTLMSCTNMTECQECQVCLCQSWCPKIGPARDLGNLVVLLLVQNLLQLRSTINSNNSTLDVDCEMDSDEYD